jgi:hypothetical protein
MTLTGQALPAASGLSPQRRAAWALATAVAALAAIAAAGRFYYPDAALHWMRLYALRDFHDLGDLWDFVAGLRTGVPPVFASAEIVLHLLIGEIRVPLAIGYYASLLACFVISVQLQRSDVDRAASLGLSLLLAAGVTGSHYLNAEPYDLYVPALATALLAFALSPPSRWPGWAAAGIALSVLELSRPFMLAGAAILAVPLIYRAAPRGRTAVLALLLPVALLSGGWHAKLLLLHGQLSISNIGAFNVADAAQSVDFKISMPAMEPEEPSPKHAGWPDLNTDIRARNNAALSRALLAAVAADPLGAVEAVVRRYVKFLALPTTMYGRDFDSPTLTPYRWLVRVGVLLSALAGLVLLVRRGWRVVIDPVGSFLLYSGFVLFCVAVCTANEEMRLATEFSPTLSLLPLVMRCAIESDRGRTGADLVPGAP